MKLNITLDDIIKDYKYNGLDKDVRIYGEGASLLGSRLRELNFYGVCLDTMTEPRLGFYNLDASKISIRGYKQ